MNTECFICGKELLSTEEIESGACFDHLIQDTPLELDSEGVPLDFNKEEYLGVADSDKLSFEETDDGC